MSQKVKRSLIDIWNLNMGFFGLQIGFNLLMTNTSRILSMVGAEASQLPLLWLVAPISGLLVQPLVGYLSDRTKSRFGKRIPYIFFGALLSALLMIIRPNSYLSGVVSPVIGAMLVIFFIQASFNLAMQPFRALVGDKLSANQSNAGYSIQSFLINIGGVIGAVLPFILATLGVSNIPLAGNMSDTLTWSFYIAAALTLLTVLWTCFTVKENDAESEIDVQPSISDSQTYAQKRESSFKLLFQIGAVQLFSWFACYYFWVYGTDAIAEAIWNTSDTSSAAYSDAANWFGVLNGIYPVFAAIFSMFLPRLANSFGRKKVYSFALIIGAIGLGSMFFIYDKYLLFFSMICYGLAWAAMLTFPFAILSSAVPKDKMGWYMGLINITIVVPQIIAGLVGTELFKAFARHNSSAMLLISGIAMLLSALSVFFIRDESV